MGKALAQETGIKNRPITSIETFASRFIIKENSCWEWVGYKGPTGYGIFLVYTRDSLGKKWTKKRKLAHRVMWELVGNSFSPALTLDHVCKNKSCVNPKHMEEVTASENTKRYMQSITHCPKGHPYSGENLYLHPIGQRVCRKCARLAQRKSYNKLHKSPRKYKFTPEEILSIRIDHRTTLELGGFYKVHPSTIGKIKRKVMYPNI